MLDRTRQPALAALWTAERETGHKTMSVDGEADRARRFREAAFPHLYDEVYTLARYLMRDAADADDAVPGMLSSRVASFRQLSRSGRKAVAARDPEKCLRRRVGPAHDAAGAVRTDRRQPSGRCATAVAGAAAFTRGGIARQWDGETIRRLVAALPAAFREAIVLRDINNLSYRDIAEVAGVPVGTVMSRLARARTMLRAAWNVEEGAAS